MAAGILGLVTGAAIAFMYAAVVLAVIAPALFLLLLIRTRAVSRIRIIGAYLVTAGIGFALVVALVWT